MALGGAKADVKVEAAVSQGGAFGVCGGGLRGDLRLRGGGLRGRGIDGIAVFVDGALEDDFAFFVLILLGRLSGRG